MFGFGKKHRPNELQASLFARLLARGRAFGRAVRATFDAARNETPNLKHWLNADGLDANAAANPSVRQTLRNRARYEISNNPLLEGCVGTLADYVIGTGSTLQSTLPDRAHNRWIEAEFGEWCKAIGLADKLHLGRQTVATVGEVFFRFVNNAALKTPVKLDLRLIEADQVATPGIALLPANAVDGIVFDADGNPQTYHVLKRHPGDTSAFTIGAYLEKEDVPAEQIMHWASIKRPGQSRGLPELTSALGLAAVLRRFILAVVTAAEFAAAFTGILLPKAGVDADSGKDPEQPEDWDKLALEIGTLSVMPNDSDFKQLTPQQPATTFVEFVREITNFMTRPWAMPRNIALGNSAQLNYSSGRLDHIPFKKRVIVERSRIERLMLDRIFTAWLNEAQLIEYYAPQPLRARGLRIPHKYGWDEWGHVDPAKESDATRTDLESGMTSYPNEYAKLGRDWETEQQQQAEALGITVEVLRKLLIEKLYGNNSKRAPAKPADEQEDGDGTPQDSEKQRKAA